MITVVQGKIGSGKSYDVTRRLIDHLVGGGVVATNMKLDRRRIAENFNRRLLPWQFVEVAADMDPRKIPRGDFRGTGRRRVMVVLDEALNWFASSASKSDPRKDTWGEWLRQSDKLGQDVFFIAQNFERSAKWLRELAQLCDSVVNFGQLAFLGIPIGKKLGLGRVYAVTTYDVSTKERLKWRMGFFSSSVWSCYSTSELYGFEASDSAYIGNVAPPYKPKFGFFFFFALLVSVASYLCVRFTL